jgi:uncharacterized membrane protein
MNPFVLALLVGVLAGSRTMLAPAAVSWAARLGWLDLRGHWVAFLAWPGTPWIFTLLAVGELVTDQLPSTPRRTVPVQLIGRVLSGALCGAAITAPVGPWINGLLLGAFGAVIGTIVGYRLRARAAAAFHRDRPAAFLEDVVALAGAFLVVVALR